MTNDQRPMTTMRVVVIGARGRLGSAIVDACAGVPGIDAIALVRKDLDIIDAAAVASTIERLAPDVVVNAAAMAGVDEAEDHPVDALNINAFGVQALARAAE